MKSKNDVLNQIKEGDILSLAGELIKFPSFTTEETDCARFIAEHLKKEGFEVELQEVETGRFQTIARLKGNGARSLMFNGHIDIDPLGDGWTRDPWKPVVEKGRLYGAGICNMKAGVTAMITAAKAIRRAGVQLKGDLVIACVAGELQAGVGTVHLLEKGLRTDAAVITEPYGTDNLCTVHAGVMEFAIHTYGVSKHISEMEKGVSAIDEMIKVIDVLRKVKFTYKPFRKLPGLPRMLVGSIIGGRGKDHELRGPNNMPDVCTIYIDVRFVPGQTPQTIIADINRALTLARKRDRKLKYEIEYPPNPSRRIARVTMLPLDVPHDQQIVQTVLKYAKEVRGRDLKKVGVILPLAYGGNDTAHLWQAGIPCCIYGPGGDFFPEQFVPVEEIVTCAKVLALTALDFCGQA
jgi:acetylornithine deacetylase